MLALKHGGANALLTIDVDGKTQLALPKQVQRDPIKGFLEHLDLIVVRKGEKVTVDIPVHLDRRGRPRGAGRHREQHASRVEAEATHIPEYIEVSIEGADGRHPDPRQGPQLPEGSPLLIDDETLIVNITHAPTAEEVEAELAEAEAEAGIERDEADETEAEAAEGEAGRGCRRARRGRLRGVTSVAATDEAADRHDGQEAVSPDRAGRRLAGRRAGEPRPVVRRHRHNVGYLVVDELAARMGGAVPRPTSPAAPTSSRAGSAPPGTRGPRVVLARPRCYMNETGGPVARWRSSTRCRPSGSSPSTTSSTSRSTRMRVKLGGGDNGHNGLRSMRASLGTGDFYRVRVGIGRPPGRQDAADFVLSDYSAAERKVLPFQVDGRRRRRVAGRRGPREDPAAVQLLTPPRLSPVTLEPGTPPAEAATDDHVLAAWPADRRRRAPARGPRRGPRGPRAQGRRRQAAHELLMALLRRAPARRRGAVRGGRRTTRRRLQAPAGLDRRPARRHPRVLRAAARRLGRARRALGGAASWWPVPSPSPRSARPSTPAARPSYRRARSDRPRIAVSRTRPPAFVEALAEELDAELVPMGSAGVKVISVARDVSRRLRARRWPVRVGLRRTRRRRPRRRAATARRIDGSQLVYNQDDVSLPDLIVCRPELADRILEFVRRHGVA